MKKGFKVKGFVLLALVVLQLSSYSQESSIEDGFYNPPTEARPGAIWRWIGGCVSQEGITRDFEEMAAKGITSVEHYDVQGPAKCNNQFMDQLWYDNFLFTLKEAKRNGIEFRKVPAAGWGIGGPWFSAEYAAKRIEYKEIQFDGKQQVDVKLPRPVGKEGYYKDIAVLAYKDKGTMPIRPQKAISKSQEKVGFFQKSFFPNNIIDYDPTTYWVSYKINGFDNPEWIELQYDKSYSFNRLTLSPVKQKSGIKTLECELRTSIDGENYTVAHSFSILSNEVKTIDIPTVTAKYVRLYINTDHNSNVILGEWWMLRESDEAYIRPGVKWWLIKSGNQGVWDYPTPEEGSGNVLYDFYNDDMMYDVKSEDIVDISSKMGVDGVLHWKVPAGRWTVIRFGEVLVGGRSREADHIENSGYEGDPFDPNNIDIMFENMVQPLVDSAGEYAPDVLSSLVIDSWEIGSLEGTHQPTWTRDFKNRFKQRNGYDLTKFLPIMANRVVDSRAKTNLFMEDYRNTLADLYIQFYTRYTEKAHELGLYTVAQNGYGTMPHQHVNGLTAFGCVDVPQCEFWINMTNITGHLDFCDPIRTASSASNIYGKKIVAAESFTRGKGWKHNPEDWKTTIDKAFCDGLNKVEFSTWSHQFRTQDRPGLSVGSQVINENVTWWEYAKSFTDYLSRCSYMLQLGKHKADFAYFIGEGTLRFVPGINYLDPELPRGFDFDGIDAEVLLSHSSVVDNKLQLNSGIKYQYLVLPNLDNWTITLPTLKRIKQLVNDGVTVVGSSPTRLIGMVSADETKEFNKLVSYLWGSDEKSIRKIKNGRVICGMSLAAITQLDLVLPDLYFAEADYRKYMRWTHRKFDDTDIYFISNQHTKLNNSVTAVFEIEGKKPELWNPITGKYSDLTQWQVLDDGRISMSLDFEHGQSYMVVFRDKMTKKLSNGVNFNKMTDFINLSKDWKVQFDTIWNGPKNPIQFEDLVSWTSFAEFNIQYYSGTANYSKTFELTPEQYSSLKDKVIILDMGETKSVAGDITLNGNNLGNLWCEPWQIDISGVLKEGENTLTLVVGNGWFNRVIYELRVSGKDRILSSNEYPYYYDIPLESGLLGPVVIKIDE